MHAICRKELGDYFTSIRFLILFLMAFLASAIAYYAASQGMQRAGAEGLVFLRLFTTQAPGIPFAFLFTFVNFVALFFIPLIGIVLGFDAINKERSSGTLSRIMSQPVFRDSVINGKFLAGIFALAIMMAIAILLLSGYGLGLRLIASGIGLPKPIAMPAPIPEEISRLFIYFVLSIIYGAFWMGLSMLFSISSRSTATSLLSSLGVWLFFSFGILVIALATAEAPEISSMVLRLSPNWLFGQATSALLQPTIRTFGTLTASQAAFMVPNPLSLGQSIILVWPQLTGLVGLTAICFAVSYVLFMRQEIRPV